MENTILFEAILIPLAAALGLSLIVERLLEFAKNVLERVLGKQRGRIVPPESALKEKIESLQKLYNSDLELKNNEENAEKLLAQLQSETDPTRRNEIRAKLAKLEKGTELDEQYPSQIFLVDPATDPDDGATMKAFILQLLGFSAGIFLAHYFGLQLFNSILSALGAEGISKSLDYLMTGLLIGGGSAPIHVLIRFITERKVTATPKEATVTSAETEEKVSASKKSEAPAVLTNLSVSAAVDWVDIPYNGGVDRELLENVHKRKSNPTMIVYHHTAMHSRSTFQDVVRVIKSRKTSGGANWITGYHCVVLADGSIHPFCRWDRYGNHAAGHNMKSLGIAFNGNFETGSGDKWSNADGRFGPSRPTEAQLNACARIIALWSLLYQISPDCDSLIIPHKQISTKACPGSNFPYDEFKRRIGYYRNKFKSPEIQERIEAFKLKSYLYL